MGAIQKLNVLRLRRLAFALATLALLASPLASGAPALGASQAPGGWPARTASVLNVRDEGHLRYLKSSGTLLIDEGAATGTIPGRVRVFFNYDGSPKVSARFTIYGAHGTLTGSAAAQLSNPDTPRPSFRGSLSLTGGSGIYAHARGRGEMFGVFYRRGYGMIVQTIGRLRY
jgi:hypothetical protein